MFPCCVSIPALHLPVLHGQFDEALLIGQENVVGARVSVQGFWSSAHRDYNSVTAPSPLQQVARAPFV